MKTWMSQMCWWLQRCAIMCWSLLTGPPVGSSHRYSPLPSREEGEGVISTAIVVMIMAFLAVGLWVAFKVLMSHATNTIGQQVSQIGQ